MDPNLPTMNQTKLAKEAQCPEWKDDFQSSELKDDFQSPESELDFQSP